MPGVGQRADRLAHGVAPDAQGLDEDGLVGDALPDRPLPAGDGLAELLDDLVDQARAAGSAQRHRDILSTNHGMYGNVAGCVVTSRARSRTVGGTTRDAEIDPGVPVIAGGTLLAVAVVLTALNLRPAVTSVAPLLGDMRAELGTSATWAGLLTTLPALCFAAAGLTAPRLSPGSASAAPSPSALVAADRRAGASRALDGPHVVIGRDADRLRGHRPGQRADPRRDQGLVPRPGRPDDRHLHRRAAGRRRARLGGHPGPRGTARRLADGAGRLGGGRALALAAWLPAARRHRGVVGRGRRRRRASGGPCCATRWPGPSRCSSAARRSWPTS